MSKYLNQVEEFHKTFKAPVLETPQLAPKERAKLRVALIQEELNELKEAIENNDLVEVADALCDLQYVLSGTVLEFGMKDRFDDMFDEVHRSNMSKVCKSYDEAIATQAYYATSRGVESIFEEQEDETYLILRKADNKALKSINYSAADLKKFLEAKKVDCPECSAEVFETKLEALSGICESCYSDKFESK